MTSFVRSSLRLLSLSLCLVLLVVGPSQAQASGEAIAVPGSRVSLVPPEDFYLSDLFSGFFNDATSASIVVTELPAAAYAQIAGGLKPGVKANGMSFTEREEVAVGGQPGFILRGTQELQGATWDKWILVFGTQDYTGMVTISSPQAVAFGNDNAVAVLNSTVLLSNEDYDPRADLGYVFSETERFELHSILQGNTALLKSKQGDGALFTITTPPNLICEQMEQTKEGEIAVAEQLLQSIQAISLSSVEAPAAVSIDGMSGIEHLAGGLYKDSNEEVTVYQSVVFGDCRYYRFVGLAPRAQGDSYRDDFRRMAESFARKQ